MASLDLTITSSLPLGSTGTSIPRLGFGVFQITGQDCITAVRAALDAGYRHIDSAQLYQNEAEVGEALRESGLAREDVFVTTKVRSAALNPAKTYQRCVGSVDKIGGAGGYVDLFLVHSPGGGLSARKALWEALETLYNEGKAKAIGVSNFKAEHIEEMKQYAKIWPPHVNQIILHPWNQQRAVVDYCEANGIVIQAHTPLVRGSKMDDPTLVAVAEKHGKTAAQVLIRYGLQKNWVPLPKSDKAERIKANADVYDFEISQQDMAVLDALDDGKWTFA